MSRKKRVVLGEQFGPHVAIEKIRVSVYLTECAHCGSQHEMKTSSILTASRIDTQRCKDCVQFFRHLQPWSREAQPGEVHGKWTILQDAGVPVGCSRRRVQAQCSCGEVHVVDYANLLAGTSTQCVACSRKGIQGERKQRRCVYCKRTREDGAPFPRGQANTCMACIKLVERNGRCPRCRFPLAKTRPHKCEGKGT